ncbi:UDP-N-acetylglucosamine 4,6-dehydratase (inverting) [Prochlorococcus marinus str. MU1404]|uniref:UDP-N-acetylglucosamine 4,6-dehydratase (inverting) n=1 Tax=Prochlorococcus marinus TaxID=1219 RepID=UPI001ADC148E|nr:UDP-N-acetylglucosamine 4,6-dehydratase (inverting) [Prochlorococcus marinus]MBO8230537.1 UDP-N-acetylglucosamine 4,6-dehydratase (inverting) [Prochlorococcus marinus XMU1404]MBW3073583.1 UDP-N-acetylglucosamine 4,6-dehydratase (inverting) [Prochlorococcus marinus str. MU1404]MCR8545130.1 UDP-N-acetylglucosamine 4,6-dehydratase (inverting) [Prochlorococcus marinus CUG1432]
MNICKNSKILITGGTGSFGKAFLSSILKKFPDISRVVIFSRDELKQWELQQKYPFKKYPQLRFFLGDIRDKERLKSALERIDIVIHAAALKQVHTAEYNPIEFIKTNILGSENLVQACIESNVKKIIALSTDKAAAPINLYGATKLCADKLFVAANNIKGHRDMAFSCVRYGNVMGSRGSVIPLFIKEAKNGIIQITDDRMTRFNITLDQSIQMVLWAIENAVGGEILVPKIASYRITDLAEAIGPSCKKVILGIREGEKLHEEMITSSDSFNTYDLGDYYTILPANYDPEKHFNKMGKQYKSVKEGFSYISNENIKFLSKENLRELIKANVDPKFDPI